MRIEHFSSAAVFLQHAASFLTADEAANNLLLGIASNLLKNPPSDEVYFAIVRANDGEIIAAAIRTTPARPVLARSKSATAIKLLASDLYVTYETLPTVMGTVENARTFAEAWTALTGSEAVRGIAQRVYQIEHVIPVTGVAGAWRKAMPSDRALLIDWMIGFQQAAFAQMSLDRAQIERGVDAALNTGVRVYTLWEVDGQSMCMLGYTGFTPNGVRIGPVYTPAEHRRHGYASALTAAVSQYLLDSGRRYCFLFTDLTNATSNHVYQTIGYTPVCDFDEYEFK
ncbi:MAG: GNAT family N-acetyltransferase [Armatimonadetes bacterium]|nr:GNAT family N-acetyltransferase [Anaerolineae bacterium]